MTTLVLPDPELTKGRFASISAYSDEALYVATGVRIAFTTREGGVSEGPYASLNLGSHVQDDLDKVLQNRALLFTQPRLSCEGRPCQCPGEPPPRPAGFRMRRRAPVCSESSSR